MTCDRLALTRLSETILTISSQLRDILGIRISDPGLNMCMTMRLILHLLVNSRKLIYKVRHSFWLIQG